MAKEKPKLKLIVKSEGKWYETDDKHAPSEGQAEGDGVPLSQTEIAAFQKQASKLLDGDVVAYRAVRMDGEQRSDYLWMDKVIKTGTLPDKMAAFIIRIQDSPVHNLHCLQQLISMVKVQGKQQCLMTADTSKDLFLEDLLPLNRKLIPFEKRGSDLKRASKKQLILWMFEDRLKVQYKNFIDALRRMASDTVDKLRGKAISIIHLLLATHAEQESVLLEMLVNKLGDPIKKVGSRALFHLNKLLIKHSRMKMVVVQEVERLLFRNNVSKRAQYYGICFLNAIRLQGEHPSLPSKLIKVYLAFFKGCVKTGEIDSKLMSGLLTGLNKAYPLAKDYGFQFSESLDTLFKIVQLSQFNIGVHALSILFQITDIERNPSQADRFYRVLYRKLLTPEFGTTSHIEQFLNLIYKAMKSDKIINRVIGFTKRLLQICHNVQPNLACAILFLISEVSKTQNGILLLGEVPKRDIVAEDCETDVSVKSDSDDEESDTTEKGKSIKRQSGSKKRIDVELIKKSTNIQFEVDQESEGSLPKPNDVNPAVKPATEMVKSSEITVVDLNDTDIVEVKDERDEKSRLNEYDPMARNPAYCGAELTMTFELAPLSEHFHPSVSLFARTLLQQRNIIYDGNPLKDFTVSRFLDRFVYRNAKIKNRLEYQPQGLRNVPVNSAAYLQSEENKIPEEEKFFYKFFTENKPAHRVKSEKDGSDAESISDDEFDDLMSTYFKSARSHQNDEDDDEQVDFAAEVKKIDRGKKRNRKSNEDDDQDSEDDESEDDISNEEEVDDDVDEFLDLDAEEEDEFDENLGNHRNFEDDDDEDDMMAFGETAKTNVKRKMSGLSGKKSNDMFAPAEAFAEMLEANAEESLSGTQTLVNKDRADMKQLKWESERDRWVKGFKKTSKTQFKNQKAKKRKIK